MRGARSARLIKISQEIKTNPNRTPKELYETLGVSKEQFYRDRRLLEQLNFKFRFSRKKKAFEIIEDAYIPEYKLTITEILSLAMSVRGIFISGDYTLAKSASDGMKKIISQLPESERKVLTGIFQDLIIRKGMGCDPEILDRLGNAVKENRRILIDYYKDSVIKRYTLDPYRIFFKNHALYLDAYSVERKSDRMFRVSRIKRVEFTILDIRHNRVIKPELIDKHKRAFSVFPGEKSTCVKVRFSSKASNHVKENPRHHTHKIIDLLDGGIIFEVEVAEPREVMWWALGWGDEAEILEPEWLRGEMVKTVRGMVEVYAKKRIMVKKI